MESLISRVSSSFNIIEDSQLLIPYLEDPATHDEVISLYQQHPFYANFIPEYGWTADQFELLDDLELYEYEAEAIEHNCVQFLIYLSRRYHTSINLHENVSPEDITAYLDTHNMVTIYIEDPDLESLRGFLIPCPDIKYIDNSEDAVEYPELYEHYLQGIPEHIMLEWYDTSFDDLKKMKLWSLISKNYAYENALVGNSYPLLTVYPEMLYPSMRPINDMSIFQTSLSNTYSSLDDIPSYKLPVTRYAHGMKSGMYYGDRPKKICGYFYYNEPSSTTYLSYHKSLTSFNKTTAARYLLDNITADTVTLYDELEQLLSQNDDTYFLDDHISGRLPSDLMMTGTEYNSAYTSDDYKLYVGKKLGLYAVEDYLDQILCKIAKLHGYDVIILTHMVGSHQVVTEVLDTRDDSFRHLWFHV